MPSPTTVNKTVIQLQTHAHSYPYMYTAILRYVCCSCLRLRFLPLMQACVPLLFRRLFGRPQRHLSTFDFVQVLIEAFIMTLLSIATTTTTTMTIACIV